jgi:hypothetical protein
MRVETFFSNISVMRSFPSRQVCVSEERLNVMGSGCIVSTDGIGTILVKSNYRTHPPIGNVKVDDNM